MDDVRHSPVRLAGFGAECNQRNIELKRFLFANIYDSPIITEDRDRSVGSLAELFDFLPANAKLHACISRRADAIGAAS